MDDLFNDEIDMDLVEEQLDEFEEEITQEDAWVVIDKYFEEKGLVRQQIDSFDEFLTHTVQELIEDSGEIMYMPEKQYIVGHDEEQVL